MTGCREALIINSFLLKQFNYQFFFFNYHVLKLKGMGFQLNRTIIFFNQMYFQFNGTEFPLNCAGFRCNYKVCRFNYQLW